MTKPRPEHLLGYLDPNQPMTVRQLGKRVGLRSPASVQYHIECLLEQGFVEHVVGWRITPKGEAHIRAQIRDGAA